MKWGAPEHLVWLWLVPALAWLLFHLLRRRRRQLHQLIAPGPAARGWCAAGRPERARLRLGLWCAALLLALLAFGRPQWGFRWEEVRRRGLDILVVLDTSRSMLAQDVKPNRLQQAKWGVRDFVRKLKRRSHRAGGLRRRELSAMSADRGLRGVPDDSG
jgi:Ca-activated chloride channel family protein